MKDELINTINKKTRQNRLWMTVSAFSMIGINLMATLAVIYAKHPEIFDLKDVTLLKSFFLNLG